MTFKPFIFGFIVGNIANLFFIFVGVNALIGFTVAGIFTMLFLIYENQMQEKKQ